MSETRIPSPTEIEARRTPARRLDQSPPGPMGRAVASVERLAAKARPRMERTAGIHSGTFGIPQADACARWNGPRRPVLICPVGCAQGAAHWWRICGVIPRFVLILAASEKTSVVVFRQATMGTI